MVELSVCVGSACHLKGSYNVIQTFQQKIEEHSLHDKIDFKASFCMKQCNKKGISVSFNEEQYTVTPETAGSFFESTVVTFLN